MANDIERNDPRPPTREDLAKFLPNKRTIRAFEKLFELVPNEIISIQEKIEIVEIVSSGNEALANANTGALAELTKALNGLASMPPGFVAELHETKKALEGLALTPQQLANLVELKKTIEGQALLPLQQHTNSLAVDYIEYRNHPKATNFKNGVVFWNPVENCQNIAMQGALLQVGLETFLRVQNETGSPILNGETVGFAGVDVTSGEILVSKYIADGTFPELYFLGVMTENLADGEVGYCTIFGKVRNLNTSAFSVEDILFASPSTAGALTTTRPTAPQKVISVAVVLVDDATNGEILVRPTIPISLDYAQYSSTVDQSLPAADTAFAVTFNSVDYEQGLSLNSSTEITVSQSGIYLFSVKLQVLSASASSKTIYAWLAKNGTDVPGSRFDFTINNNNDTKVFSAVFQISLVAGDYVEIFGAGSSTDLSLDALPSVAFAPTGASALVTVTQIQL